MKRVLIILWSFIFSLQAFAAFDSSPLAIPDIATHLNFKESSRQFDAHGHELMVYMYKNQYIQTLFDHQEQGVKKGKWWILDVEEKSSRKVLLRMRLAPVAGVSAKFPTELIGVYRYNDKLNGSFIMDLADQVLKKFNLESYLYDDSRIDIELNIDQKPVAFPIFLRLFRKLVKGKTWYEEQGYTLCDIKGSVICPRYNLIKSFKNTPRFRLHQNDSDYQKALNTIRNTSLADLKILLKEDGSALNKMIQAVSDKSVKTLGELFVALQLKAKKLNQDHLSPAYLYHLAFQKILPWQGDQEEDDTWSFTDPWSAQKIRALDPYFKKTYPRQQFVVSDEDDEDDDVYKSLLYSWKNLFNAVHTMGHSVAFRKPAPFSRNIQKATRQKPAKTKKKRNIKLILDDSPQRSLAEPAKKRQKTGGMLDEIHPEAHPLIAAVIRGDKSWVETNSGNKDLVNQKIGRYGVAVFLSNYIANVIGSYRMKLWEMNRINDDYKTLNQLVLKYEAMTNLLLKKSKSSFKNMAYEATYIPGQNVGLLYDKKLLENYIIDEHELNQMIED